MSLNDLELNVEQLKAVREINGPVMVVAGAGTGKTRILTARIAYLIQECDCPDNHILAITFTNLACNEMRNRISKLLNRHHNINIFTFHSLCLKILREDIDKLNGLNSFRILDDDEKLSVINQIFNSLELRKKLNNRIKSKLLLKIISEIQDCTYHLNNDLWSLTVIKVETINILLAKHAIIDNDIEYIWKVYKEYQDQKRKNNWLDFNDLIYGVYKLFNKHKEIAWKWSKRFQYILVDEFQDTDYCQFHILKQLVNENRNIFVVGDPDQTIYEWRGAYSRIFDDFIKCYGDVKQIIVSKNYRSTKKILMVANALINNNVNRIKKSLITCNNDGGNVIYYQGDSQYEEGKFIASTISELIKKKYELKDIAILYRNNFLSRFVEKALIDHSINYQIYGGVKFYQRKEIKDIIAYLRIISNFNDELALKRIINIPPRGIGEITLNKILTYSVDHKITLYEAIQREKSSYPDITWDSTKLLLFLKTINDIKKIIDAKPISEKVKVILEKIQYENYLNSFENPAEVISRMDNIKELISSIKEQESLNKNLTIDEYLQSIALYTDSSVNDFKSRDNNSVKIMTIHFAKGAEFKVVFICGLYEGSLPTSRSINQNNLEEERRIFFVGITRARERLFLTSNIGSNYSGQCVPSYFLKEIGEKNYEKKTSEFSNISSANLEWYNSKKDKNFENMYDDEKIEINVGDTVVHTVFGLGYVLGKDGKILNIAFKKPYGNKTIIANHKSIKRVKN